MSGGRSDLVISDMQGSSLLVVEYKQRHSGQASACQQQDMAQVGTNCVCGVHLAAAVGSGMNWHCL